MLTHLSTFSGIEGIGLAAEAEGFQAVGHCDIEPFAREVIRHHWPDTPIWWDIRHMNRRGLIKKLVKQGVLTRDPKFGSLVDLLSGGFPCQPFSLAGERRGEFDERHLFPELARFIREVRPRWVLLENVPGLFSANAGRVFRDVLGALAEMGYRVGWCCYGAGEVGAPHRRERVFIIGCLANTTGDAGSQRHQFHGERRRAGETEQVGLGGRKGELAHTTGARYGSEPGSVHGDVPELGGRCQADYHQSGCGGQSGGAPHVADAERAERRAAGPGYGGLDGGLSGLHAGRQEGAGRLEQRCAEGSRTEVADPAQQSEREPHDQTDPDARRGATRQVPGRGSEQGGTRRSVDTGRGGEPQSRLGGALDGLPPRMDLDSWPGWPARPGQEQYSWEPPRVAQGIKDRVARLKALGNAVVPAQVRPILRAIREAQQAIASR